MSDPSLELQAALVGALKASPDVQAIVGARVYYNPPATPTFPYISIGTSQVLPDKADCIDGTEVFINIDGWSRNLSFPETKQIGKAVIVALDDQDLVVSGYLTVVCEISNTNYMDDPDGITEHVALSFRLLLQAL